MLHAVLNMPPEIWSNSELDIKQRYSRYKDASRRIYDLNKAILLLAGCDNHWKQELDFCDIRLINDLLERAEG